MEIEALFPCGVDDFTPAAEVCMIHTIKSAAIIARLKEEGWVLHHVKGSHFQFKHPEKSGRITVPHPRKDLPTGTLRSIFRQAGWPRRD